MQLVDFFAIFYFNVLFFSRVENLSGSEPVTGSCDVSGEDCADSSSQTPGSSEKIAWKPFHYESNHLWVSLHLMFPAYIKWHNETLFSSEIPCEEKKVLIFSPNAGLGDSIGGLSSAFFYTIKTGRMLFIHWKPFHWTVGLKPLKFFYDYSAAKKLRDPMTGRPLLCVDSNDPASFLDGHVTNQHAIIKDKIVNDFVSSKNFPSEKITELLIQPSKNVEDLMHNVITLKSRDEELYANKINISKVALVMRTGIGEYNQFLSEGDEMIFVKCLRNYAKSVSTSSDEKYLFRVFVTSDNLSVKKKVVEELTTGDNGGVNFEVVTLQDSIVHVMHVKKSEIDSENKKKIRKTFAEFFLIGQCHVLFLTHGSLFGRVAAERVDESNVHFISDSNCDGTREKYSYLHCHQPKYPKACGFG